MPEFGFPLSDGGAGIPAGWSDEQFPNTSLFQRVPSLLQEYSQALDLSETMNFYLTPSPPPPPPPNSFPLQAARSHTRAAPASAAYVQAGCAVLLNPGSSLSVGL